MMTQQVQWLTASEAAAHLRVAHRTVLVWAKMGRIPAHRLSGAQRVTWRFRADELDAFMSNGEMKVAETN
jgi:excisionase family DNA binding protein